MYVKAEDFKNASLLFEKADNIPKAVQMAEKGGDIERAAMLAQKSGYPDKAASLLVRMRKYDKAVEIYFNSLQDAINASPNGTSEDQRMNMKKYGVAAGNIYYRLKNYSKAAWCYEQGESYAKAAECYLLTNNSEKAGELYYRAQYYDKAYELLTAPGAPVSDPAVLADVCFYTKRYSEAGDLYVAANQRERAAEAYELSTNMYKAALLYEETGNLMKAADIYSSISEPARAASLYEKAGFHAEAGAYYESAGMLDRATECYLKIGEKNHAAIAMARQGKLEEAAPLLQQITNDEPEYREACLMLGEFFANKGMESLALQKFNEVIGSEALSKGNVDLYYRLAGVFERLNKKDKAQELYEKIMLLQMNYRDVFEKLQHVKASASTTVWEAPESQVPTQPTTPVPSEESAEAQTKTESFVGKRLREYDVLEMVGKGGMSMVYRAKHIYLNKQRAIKIIQTELADQFFSDRFIQEARILADLHNPHLVQLFEFGSLEGNQLFMVLEWIEGESAKQRVQRLGRIPASDAIRIVREAATGLQVAHENGIIHRDISPDNLMLVNDPSGKEVTKVIDFGIAKSARESTHTRTNLFLGKPQYASPEQCGFLKENEVLDARSDLYSLGITFYYMLTGKSPFSSPTPQGYLVKHISQKAKLLAEQMPIYERPELLDELISKMLEPDRSKRHASISEFIVHLDQVAQKRN
jgi:tRNA A-37 threonylcarbamoyl transferase component Bud32